LTDDDSRLVSQNCSGKRENIERLQAELKSMEKRAVSVQQQIDSCITELGVSFSFLFGLLTFISMNQRKSFRGIFEK